MWGWDSTCMLVGWGQAALPYCMPLLLWTWTSHILQWQVCILSV